MGSWDLKARHQRLFPRIGPPECVGAGLVSPRTKDGQANRAASLPHRVVYLCGGRLSDAGWRSVAVSGAKACQNSSPSRPEFAAGWCRLPGSATPARRGCRERSVGTRKCGVQMPRTPARTLFSTAPDQAGSRHGRGGDRMAARAISPRSPTPIHRLAGTTDRCPGAGPSLGLGAAEGKPIADRATSLSAWALAKHGLRIAASSKQE